MLGSSGIMALPFVLIEVAPAPESAEYQAAMITACNEAIRHGICVPAGAAPPNDTPAALAIVSWEGSDKRTAHIQVGLPRGPRASWLSREMQFRSADARVEQWRAVGFAIGTLAEEHEARRDSASPDSRPAAAPVQPVVQPSRESSPRLSQRWLGIGALTGPGLDQGSWRAGAWASGAHRFGGTPWFANVSASYAVGNPGAGVSMEWFTFAAGLGASYPATRKLELRARADLGWQLVRASVEDEAGRTDRGARWSAGPRLALQSAWRVSDGVALAAGLEGWKLSSSSEIRLRGERFGSSRSLGFAALMGLEFFLP